MYGEGPNMLLGEGPNKLLGEGPKEIILLGEGAEESLGLGPKDSKRRIEIWSELSGDGPYMLGDGPKESIGEGPNVKGEGPLGEGPLGEGPTGGPATPSKPMKFNFEASEKEGKQNSLITTSMTPVLKSSLELTGKGRSKSNSCSTGKPMAGRLV